MRVDAAHQVVLQYQEETDPEEISSFIDDSDQVTAGPNNEEILSSFIINSGLYYTHGTNTQWILILLWFLNTKVSVKDEIIRTFSDIIKNKNIQTKIGNKKVAILWTKKKLNIFQLHLLFHTLFYI